LRRRIPWQPAQNTETPLIERRTLKPKQLKIAIVGGGPAGLRAAELCAAAGAAVTVFDARRSVGRKLLVAGYGGLNLTHGEPLDAFVGRYTGGPGFPARLFEEMIRRFPPGELRAWAAALGIETFEQRTGRVYPHEMKAAPLLRRWVERLRRQGVRFEVNAALSELGPGPFLQHLNADERLHFDAIILALGGASWPRTGSDGSWLPLLVRHGIEITPFQPANCGWEHPWPAELVSRLEGQPLKNLRVHAGPLGVDGELMLTRYGLEGGAVYQLGPILRAMPEPALVVDLKPEVPEETLLRKMESVRRDFLDAAATRWKLGGPARLLLDHFHGPFHDVGTLAHAAKNLAIPLTGPRPIAEAISSAGGVAWSEIDDTLMLHKLPGVFVAGEMIDWEAPTGGYLIQACFATATHAARGALAFALDR